MKPYLCLNLAMLVACGPAKPQTPGDSDGSTGTTASNPSGSSTGAPTSAATTSPSPTTSCDTACSTSDEGGVIPDFITQEQIECDVLKQDCAPGEKCTAWNDDGGMSWNATKCVPVTGDKLPGEVCMTDGGATSGIDNCEAGAMCWDVEANGMGICRALCTGTPDAPVCELGFQCFVTSGESLIFVCLPPCDPLLQDCPDDDLCLPSGDRFFCLPDASGDMGKTNDPCEFQNACDKGLVCLSTPSASSACMPGSQGCCQPFCDFTAMDKCPNPDQKCVQWFDPMMPIPPGFEDVGVCAIPI